MVNRKYYLDLLRILAIILVLLNHSVLFECFMVNTGLSQFFYFMISTIISIDVPIFLMISGSLLFDKNETWSEIIHKRVFRFIIVLISIQMFLQLAYWLSSVIGGGTYSYTLLDFIEGLLIGELKGAISYWFLYGYIGFLLFMPFLRLFAQQMTFKDFKILVFLYFGFNVIIPFNSVIVNQFLPLHFEINNYLLIPVASTRTLFFPLLGYYLDKKVNIDKINKSLMIKLHLFAAIMIVLSFGGLLLEYNLNGTYSQLFVRVNELVLSSLVFIDVKKVMGRIDMKSKFKTILITISSICFGVYLLDPILQVFFSYRFSLLLDDVLSPLMISLLWCAFSFAVGGVIVNFLKTNKFIRKFI